ncbi:MAG: family finger-like protein [Deltaproteobacteria bacterium]|nr:family finger-like protein [Deltaproteobacteria bacterium]
MTDHRDDAGEDALAGIDLHAWRVPPPAAVDRPSLLVRGLSPAATPAKRPRIGWIMAAIVLLNAAIATLIVILLARSPGTQPTVAVQPAGGGPIDPRVHDLLQRLEQEQRALERKLAEIQELRALVVELSEKVRRYEQQDGRRDRTVPKQPARPAPERIDRPLIDPYDTARPGSCDEVSCVLTNYEGTCCAKFRSPRAPITDKNPPTNGVPDTLDRQSASNGVASVKPRVAACAAHSTARGMVKVRIQVGADGLVTNVSVEDMPDVALGACVAAAVQRAVFPRTQHGGVFSYPFVF